MKVALAFTLLWGFELFARTPVLRTDAKRAIDVPVRSASADRGDLVFRMEGCNSCHMKEGKPWVKGHKGPLSFDSLILSHSDETKEKYEELSSPEKADLKSFLETME